MQCARHDRAQRYHAAGYWDDRTLASGIEAAANHRPRSLALADHGLRLDHDELRRAVNAGVATLRASGVRAGDAAVLVAGNTCEAAIAYHALLRSGVLIVALDRRCGPGDVRHALDVIGRRVHVVAPTTESARLLEGIDVDRIPLESFRGVPADASTTAWPEPGRDEPAVVLFTSGTTSRPKGVIHSINTLTAGAANLARIAEADETTIEFLVSPVTSIAGIMQMHLAADQHAALVLEDHFDPEGSLDRINAAGATLLGGAPVIAQRLLDAAVRRGSQPIALQTLALGGAMLPRPLLELATETFDVQIARVYGSSEAPNFTGSLPTDERERRLSDDGALMPGSEVRIGSSEHPQEAMVRGPGVFLGYIDPGDTDAAFEDDWFRTGDLVEMHDGRLTVTGRLKEVVVRNGLKISLNEIEGALAGLPGVREHACFSVPDAQTGEHLVVAVLLDDSGSVTLDTVTEHLVAQGTARRKLPEEIVYWDGPLPRTASGKVVRAQLQMDAPSLPSERSARLRS